MFFYYVVMCGDKTFKTHECRTYLFVGQQILAPNLFAPLVFVFSRRFGRNKSKLITFTQRNPVYFLFDDDSSGVP